MSPALRAVSCLGPLFCCLSLSRATASFLALGDLPGGDFASSAIGISKDGRAVVGFGTTAVSAEAFRWTASSGMMSIEDNPGDNMGSYATSASQNGDVIVGQRSTPEGFEAFRWTASGGMMGLGDLAGGDFNSYALGVCSNGSIAVGASASYRGQEAFCWTSQNGMQGLGSFPGQDFFSEARGVSASGDIIVGQAYSPDGFQAFLWTNAGGFVGLGDLPGGAFNSRAEAVSSDGTIVVGEGQTVGRERAFVWTPATGMQPLPPVPGVAAFTSTALCTSDHGEVIGGRAITSDLGAFAVIWLAPDRCLELKQYLINHGAVGLDGWRLVECTGVSSSGRYICGWGFNPNGQTEAWYASIDDPTVRTVSGRINFQDLDPDATRIPGVHFEFREPGTTNVVAELDGALDSQGRFTIDCPSPPAVYDLSVKHLSWLRKNITIDCTTSNVGSVYFDLINGDCNNNNEVGLFDYALISYAFGSAAGDWNFVLAADLNHDFEVNLGDYSILAKNFGLIGDD